MRIRIPDPACYFDADPDPARHFDADPDPDPSFQLKAQNLEKCSEKLIFNRVYNFGHWKLMQFRFRLINLIRIRFQLITLIQFRILDAQHIFQPSEIHPYLTFTR
jgi:hypothetical protein